MFFFNNALLNSVYLSACVFLPVNFFPLLVSFISSFTFLPTCRVIFFTNHSSFFDSKLKIFVLLRFKRRPKSNVSL